MKKTIIKSNGIKAATPADCLEKEDVQKLKNYFLSLDLSKPNNLRNYALLVFNLNVGLRAGDLLRLPKELIIKNHKVVDIFSIREQKTGKKRIIELNDTAKKVVQDYYEAFKEKLEKSFYLFPSRKHGQGSGHLTLSSFDKILREAKKKSGINDAYTVSSHICRKVLGTTLYEQGVAIEEIQEMFNHSRGDTTLIYIGAIKKKSRKLYHKVSL